MTNEEKLRKALCRIETGSFDNAITMATEGHWKAMYNALQKIASNVLVETLGPSPSPAPKDKTP